MDPKPMSDILTEGEKDQPGFFLRIDIRVAGDIIFPEA
jgi:hypothetical protein